MDSAESLIQASARDIIRAPGKVEQREQSWMGIGASGRAQEFLVQERPRGNHPGLHPALLVASLNIRKGDTQQEEEASDRGGKRTSLNIPPAARTTQRVAEPRPGKACKAEGRS